MNRRRSRRKCRKRRRPEAKSPAGGLPPCDWKAARADRRPGTEPLSPGLAENRRQPTHATASSPDTARCRTHHVAENRRGSLARRSSTRYRTAVTRPCRKPATAHPRDSEPSRHRASPPRHVAENWRQPFTPDRSPSTERRSTGLAENRQQPTHATASSPDTARHRTHHVAKSRRRPFTPPTVHQVPNRSLPASPKTGDSPPTRQRALQTPRVTVPIT
ncbi:hypothetical protein H4W30_003426 [Amycolatopsis roodepoortensis]|uniref:Uncharacterized protein n=1 Tax=Amycolatopsis roodepoortensis TaxID=700274 RepID=A0ABR9L6N6_9PSEU|nr:hypothetical protein [Amycolatopsis roodepoortensis]